MKKNLLVLITLCLLSLSVFAKSGYEIKVKLANYTEKQLVLGYHLADKQYIKDTVTADEKGWFTFKDKDGKELPAGIYLVITMPEKQYFQVLVDKDDQFFSVETDAKEPMENMKIKGSNLNKDFYAYMDFLAKQRKEADKVRAQMKIDSADTKKRENWSKELDKIDASVKSYLAETLKKQDKTLIAAIIKGSQDIDVPEFKEEKDVAERQRKRYFYYKNHFFDNFNMGDSRLLRSPVQFNRVEYYVNKLTQQIPDSINNSVDRVLQLVKPSEESYKFYLIHFLNYFAKSNIVGMDACYVHIAKNYYAKGEANWTEKEQLDKIIDNAKTLEPILIGKTAPNLNMQKRDGTPISLYDIKAPYTIIFIWDPECGHCKKSMPAVMDFYEKYKDKGIEIFAICNRVTDKVPQCWEYIDTQKRMTWLNVVDPYLLSKYNTLYDVKSTPQVFILDKEKKIISKRIAGEQLGEVMDEIIKIDNERMKMEKK
ncbi:MAG: hypothetical protein RLZZ292_760 [Bacteroidota bacterium]|jgi:thiol-disulfide isomerase/thioredoxin